MIFIEKLINTFLCWCSGAKEPIFSFWKLWLYAGPGLLMSIAYFDPGNSK